MWALTFAAGDSMDTERLARMADVTRRYGKYRPCGAGLGVVWGGLLLGTLGLLQWQWAQQEYARHAVASQSLWRFLRDTPLTPPGWLQIAAVAAPFVAWLGLVGIQAWVDRQFGAVTTSESAGVCSRPRGPRWMAPFLVILLACLLSGVVIWDAPGAALRGVAAMLAIAAWALVWGRGSRDQLTLLVMLAASVPSLYMMAATDPNANFTAGNMVVFAAYFVLMLWLLLQGVLRFSGFLKVRADLAAMQPVEE
jgi:hypothetical protein